MSDIENNGVLPYFPIPEFVFGYDCDREYSYVIHTQSPRFIAAYGDCVMEVSRLVSELFKELKDDGPRS